MRLVLQTFSLVLCFAFQNGWAQHENAPLSIKYSVVQKAIAQDTLHPHLKCTNDSLRVYFYAAIAYYPELYKVKFKIVERNINTMMQVRPRFLNAFKRPHKRRYTIFVNRSAKKFIPTLRLFTFNAGVGIMGHELAHVTEYVQTRFIPLIKLALNYKKTDFKTRFERNTDMRTLEHNLGWQLYDYAVQWENLPDAYQNYKTKKQTFYLNAKQMLGLMLSIGYR